MGWAFTQYSYIAISLPRYPVHQCPHLTTHTRHLHPDHQWTYGPCCNAPVNVSTSSSDTLPTLSLTPSPPHFSHLPSSCTPPHPPHTLPSSPHVLPSTLLLTPSPSLQYPFPLTSHPPLHCLTLPFITSHPPLHCLIPSPHTLPLQCLRPHLCMGNIASTPTWCILETWSAV